MEYIRKVIDSDILGKIINIPDALKHKKVEIIIIPVENKAEKNSQKEKKLFGVFEDYSNPYLIKKEKNAWRNAVSEKHADN